VVWVCEADFDSVGSNLEILVGERVKIIQEREGGGSLGSRKIGADWRGGRC